MDKNNEYFQCFRMIFHILKIFGVFPFIFSHRGTSKYLFTSRVITFFAIILFVPLCTEQYTYVIKNTNLMLANFQFNTFVRIIPPVTGRIVFLLLPIITWRNNKQIYIHVKKWKKLQDKLTNIQKVEYSSPLKNLIPFINTVVIITSVSLLVPLKPYFDLNMTISAGLASFLYLGVALLSMVLYWCTNCLFVALVAKQTLRLIKDSITTEDEITFIKLIEFWEDLYDWNAGFTSTVSVMFLILLSSMIVTMVTCFYSFTYLIVVEEDKIAGLAYFVFASTAFMILLTICESAYLLLKQISTTIQDTMLTTHTTRLNLRLLKVILIFLQTIEAKKPKIMVNGVMTINRSSIITIFSTSVNFMIVLKQFHRLE